MGDILDFAKTMDRIKPLHDFYLMQLNEYNSKNNIYKPLYNLAENMNIKIFDDLECVQILAYAYYKKPLHNFLHYFLETINRAEKRIGLFKENALLDLRLFTHLQLLLRQLDLDKNPDWLRNILIKYDPEGLADWNLNQWMGGK